MATPINHFQPALVVTETIAMSGIFPSREFDNGGMTMGMFHTYGFTYGLGSAPSATGQLLSIAQNPALFSILGTSFGGNVQSTFNLPDLRARTSVSQGQGPGLSDSIFGQITGAATSLVAQANLPPLNYGGAQVPVDEDQPALGVRYLIRVDGIFPSQGGFSSTLNLIGSVVKFAGDFTPGGYVECNGQLLDIAANTALFSVIGITYGGDGQTTFAVPDLRGRTIVGAGGGYGIGDAFGSESVTLSRTNLPVQMGGNGVPLDNREPSLVLNYAIALAGIFPAPNSHADPYDPMLGEIITFAGNFPPSGYALCHGQLLPINQNQALFSLLGTTYGGDGRTTFALPDFRGRTAVGSGNGFATGDRIGSNTTTLTLDNIPDLAFSGSNNGENLYGGNGNDSINGLGGNDTIASNGGDDVLNGGDGNDTMQGGAGNDVYYVGQAGDLVVEALGAGASDLTYSFLSNYTLAANVERLTLLNGAQNGTGNTLDNVLVGNSAANALSGGFGNDRIDGGAGIDTMNGGIGNDVYVIDSSNDIIVDGAGIDTIFANFNATLSIYPAIENLILTGFAFQGLGNALANRIVGTTLANNLTGENGDDVLEGGQGNDTLNGGLGNDRLDGGAGNDTMTGGVGNDVFIVDSIGDTIVELAGGGAADRVEATTTINALHAQVEDLTLLGSLHLNGTGNALANRITGNSGNNTLDGLGGVDILQGGAGNDIYRIDVAGETIFEAAGGGTDKVESVVSYVLANNLENLTLLGSANINGTGTAANNILIGNSGDNVLNGGPGVDAMSGGGGNDTYSVENPDDTVFENNVPGIDLVLASLSFALPLFVENLTLMGAAANGTGNSQANIITGNPGNNTLDGAGGADTMNGFGGNDIYVVDNAGDVVIDASGAADEVRSSVTRTLESAIENLTLTGLGVTDGTGNALANVIVGNAQANTLDGKAGADTMTGGLGADRFRFTVLENVADTISDFAVGVDKIAISAAAFGGGLVAGNAIQIKFAIGIPIPTGNQGQFLFNDANGNLYFDRNGAGAGELFHIAVVPGAEFLLAASDFLVVP